MNQRLQRITLLATIAHASGVALAQSAPADQSALIFNELFNVGGIGNRNPQEFIGTVACGAGSGTALTAALNEALAVDAGGTVDRDAANGGNRAGARDLWRFCDNMVNSGGGWTTFAIPSFVDGDVDLERAQNSGLAPDELFAQVDQAAAITRAQNQNVGGRIKQLRLAQSDNAADDGTRLALQTDMAFSFEGGLNAGDDTAGPARRLGFYANGRYIDLEGEGSAVETASDTDGYGVTVGLDYLFTDRLLAGVGVGFTSLDTQFTPFGVGNAQGLSTGASEIRDVAFQLYGSYFIGNSLFVDLLLGASFLEFDNVKNVPAFDLDQAGADTLAPLRSSPNGDTLFANLSFGYDWRGSRLTVSPYLRAEYLQTQIDGFTETSGTGDDTLSLTINEQSNTSLTFTGGLSLSTPFSTRVGVISPYARFEWVVETRDQGQDISGFLTVFGPQVSFSLPVTNVDDSYGFAGGGVTATFASGWAAFVDVDFLLGFQDVASYQTTLGIRKQF